MERNCNVCKETKPMVMFNKDRSCPGGISRRCKTCESARALKWNLANRERKNANNKAYAERDRGKAKKWAKEWRSRKGAEWLKAYEAARYPKRKHLVIAANKLRKALLLKACPPWANRKAIAEMYELARRRTEETGREWHVDHIVPLRSKVVCGLHVESNLRVIHGMENLAKNNYYWPDMPEGK